MKFTAGLNKTKLYAVTESEGTYTVGSLVAVLVSKYSSTYNNGDFAAELGLITDTAETSGLTADVMYDTLQGTYIPDEEAADTADDIYENGTGGGSSAGLPQLIAVSGVTTADDKVVVAVQLITLNGTTGAISVPDSTTPLRVTFEGTNVKRVGTIAVTSAMLAGFGIDGTPTLTVPAGRKTHFKVFTNT